MNDNTALVEQSASVVRRARAGDENAMALLVRVGEEARKGTNKRAQEAYATLKSYIERNPAQPFFLASEPPVIAYTPPQTLEAAKAPSAAIVPTTPTPKPKIDLEARKPTLPRGIFDHLFDPDSFALTVVRACQYRNGLPAAATVLASGPPLTNLAIRDLGYSNFGSDEDDEPSAIFFHGVKFSGEDAWLEVAPYLEPPLRRCLAIGQCVGRARRLQAVRQPDSRIGAFSEVAGWELGE